MSKAFDIENQPPLSLYTFTKSITKNELRIYRETYKQQYDSIVTLLNGSLPQRKVFNMEEIQNDLANKKNRMKIALVLNALYQTTFISYLAAYGVPQLIVDYNTTTSSESRTENIGVNVTLGISYVLGAVVSVIGMVVTGGLIYEYMRTRKEIRDKINNAEVNYHSEVRKYTKKLDVPINEIDAIIRENTNLSKLEKAIYEFFSPERRKLLRSAIDNHSLEYDLQIYLGTITKSVRREGNLLEHIQRIGDQLKGCFKDDSMQKHFEFTRTNGIRLDLVINRWIQQISNPLLKVADVDINTIRQSIKDFDGYLCQVRLQPLMRDLTDGALAKLYGARINQITHYPALQEHPIPGIYDSPNNDQLISKRSDNENHGSESNHPRNRSGYQQSWVARSSSSSSSSSLGYLEPR